MQLEGLHLQRRILGAQAAGGGQDLGGIVGHGGDDVGAGQQAAQAVELRHGQDHMALAPDLFQDLVHEPAQVAGKRYQRVGAGAEVVQAQAPRHAVGTQHLGFAAPQHLALGVGRQVVGPAHADGDFPRGQQRGHQQVVDPAHHQDDARGFGAHALEQLRQQGEFGVVRQADAKHRGAGGWIEVGSAADRGGDRIQRWREQGEDLHRPRRRFHAAPGTHEQRVVEQVAQARQGGADGRLAEEQFLCRTGHATLVHQGLEDDQQVQVDATQVVTVHRLGFTGRLGQG
ncbi:hypothetical protein D3C77_153250 [compost metagenome]